MKNLLPILTFIILLFGCTTNNRATAINSNTNKMTFEPNEDGEYDIIVMAPQYEVYLKSIARPKEFYSEEYYKTQNRFYVVTWNQRHMMPTVYNPDLYAVSIDLDPTINYGYEFEYKLFNFFKFIEWKYRIRLR